jgi:membrane protein
MSSVLRVIKSILTRLKSLLFGLGRGIKDIFWGLYNQDALGLAAQVAYSVLFSLFPFLLLLNALAAYIPGADQVADWLLAGLRNLVSVNSKLYDIVQNNIFFEVGALSATFLSVGIVLTLWSASGAVMVLLKAIQRAYGLQETRSWQKRRSLAVVWAVAGVVIIPVGVLLLLAGGWIGDRISDRYGVYSALHVLWIGLRWPVVLVLLIGMLGVFFRLGSSVRHRWYGVFPGAVFSVGGIIAATTGLSWFLSQKLFVARWLTYGVIGSVIVILFWAFLVGLVVLIGAQINAVVCRAVEKNRGSPAAAASQEDPEGQLIESPSDD